MGDIVLQHQTNPGALGANLSCFFFNMAGEPAYVGNDAVEHVLGGTVTSVGLTAPAIFAVANSPVTGAGNLALTLVSQNAAQVLAGPATGNAAAPVFRALAGGDLPKLVVNAQTANYTLALADANCAYVRVNSGSNLAITVPSHANVPFANGSAIVLNRAGAGNLTVTQQVGVTVNNSSSNQLRAQGSGAVLVMVSPDLWDLFGDLV